MNSAAQLAAGVAVRKSAASLFLGQRDRMRLQKKFADRAPGRDALAVVPAQQFDYRDAVLDDSRVLLGRDLDVVVGTARFGARGPIDPCAGSRITAEMRFEQRSCIDHYAVDICQQFALLERAYVSAPWSLVEIAQPSLGERRHISGFVSVHLLSRGLEIPQLIRSTRKHFQIDERRAILFGRDCAQAARRGCDTGCQRSRSSAR